LKGNYYKIKLENNQNNPKKLWKTLKEMLPNESSNSTLSSLKVDDRDITKNVEMANQLNSFFSSVGDKLASKFGTTTTNEICPNVNDEEFRFSHIQQSIVAKMINSLENGKATGVDGVGVRLLKAGCPVFSYILTIIFNKSLTTGYVPRSWKVKRISPLFKSGDRNNQDNYRPISIMPIGMKFFKKIVHDQFVDFIKNSDILMGQQSGFRKHFSTSTAVVDVADYITSELSKGKFVCATLIDLRKAFDTVDHQILLKKLFCCGVRDVSFDWFLSYLSKRQQTTVVNNEYSELLFEMAYGVPQGSVLGPLLFLIYINDIATVISMYNHLYADDTIIVHAADNQHLYKCELENQLKRVECWFRLKKLTTNTKKCEVIYFGSKQKLQKCKEMHSVVFEETVLETKSKVKYLGVIFDEELSWKGHTSIIRKKVGYKLSKLKRIESYLSERTKKQLVNALIMPYYHYCSVVWSSATASTLKKLESQYIRVKQMYGPERSVRTLLDKNLSLFTIKAIYGLSPSYISDKVSLVNQSRQRVTRQSTSNHLVDNTTYRNRFSNMTFKHVSSNLWNSLPSNITCENSIVRFKSKTNKFYSSII
jgi:hypothetical protein